ncbi:retrovirus-related pol polyprotein from transposon TNT 1-94 [Tanacetum coccineum]
MLKIDVEPITLKLLNKKTAHSAYIKHTQEEATVLGDLVEHVKSKYPLDHSLESACRYAKLIQELLTHMSKTCPCVNNTDGKLVAVTPKNKDKRVRFTEPVTSSGNTITKTTSTSNLVSNKPMLSSTGVKPSTSASGSQPSGNTKKDKIQQTLSSTQKNKVKAYPRKVKYSLKNKDCVVAPKGSANVQHSKLNANSKLKCVKCNGCMLFDNHDLCVLDFINNVNVHVKSKSVKKSSKKKIWKPIGKVFTNIRYIWRPTGRTFTIVGNACPLTRITIITELPRGMPSALDNKTPKPVVTLVYSRKPRKSKTNGPDSKSKVVQIFLTDNGTEFVNQTLRKYYEKIEISHETSVAHSPQQNGVIERRNRTLIEVARTTLIYAKAPLFLWAEAVATAYFDELTAMASEHNSSGPALHDMTPATISSGLIPNPPPSTPFVPPSRSDWDILFQPLFDELHTPPPNVDLPAPEVIAPIVKVVALEPADSTEDDHDLDVTHMNNDPFFGILILEHDSEASSSSDVIPTVVHTATLYSEHVNKWTKDHPLENIIGELQRPVSTRLQLHEQALLCYYDDFLTSVEPKKYKDALTQACWIEAMQEKLNEFERLEV